MLIIDNHSTDNTDEVVKGFNDTRINLFKIHNKNRRIACESPNRERSNGGTYVARS